MNVVVAMIAAIQFNRKRYIAVNQSGMHQIKRQHLLKPDRVRAFKADTQGYTNYYPYGMLLPERNGNATEDEYRYAYNGMETDNEVSGNGNSYTTEFRQYDPRLMRWKSLDPLMHQFPWMSPYVAFDNNPVYYIDPFGLEGTNPDGGNDDIGGDLGDDRGPGLAGDHGGGHRKGPDYAYLNNPENNGPNEKRAMEGVGLIGAYTYKKYHEENWLNLGAYSTRNSDIRGTFVFTNESGYVTDTPTDPTNKYNMHVGTDTKLNVDESQASEFSDYESFIISRMMRNFITGTGAENYVFPQNGIISSKFLGSDVLNAALKDYNAGISVVNTQYSFLEGELLNDAVKNKTLFGSITGFAGSVSITIKPTSNGILVEISNITSLTSGDYLKDLGAKPSRSYVRKPGEITPYGNISQTFKLFIPYKK